MKSPRVIGKLPMLRALTVSVVQPPAFGKVDGLAVLVTINDELWVRKVSVADFVTLADVPASLATEAVNVELAVPPAG